MKFRSTDHPEKIQQTVIITFCFPPELYMTVLLNALYTLDLRHRGIRLELPPDCLTSTVKEDAIQAIS